MFPAVDVTRRTFLVHAGRGTIALAVLGVAGCGPAVSGSPAGGSPSPRPSAGAPSTPSSASAPPPSPSAALTWRRVDLGFVSAYLLARGGEVAVVDVGVPGSEGEIEAGLGELGLGWDAVGHVVLTHRHNDHVGSAPAVLAAAPEAAGYAGAADIPSITVPRPVTPVADGDDVFGLRIVETPGHTAGHIAVLDEVGGVLVAGDALGTEGGAVVGPNRQFTTDMDQAMASIAKLGGLTFEALLVGHGDPILEGASGLVAAFAGS
jgi:glyoxylase-like metal-dependent hydrolase (beta-lactamase superfamily II)